MRVTMLLTKKYDNDDLYRKSANFLKVLEKISENFKSNMLKQDEDLVKEILLYQIDYYRSLMIFRELHVFLNRKEVVRSFIEMLQEHSDEKIVKALSLALKEASNTTQFYPDLLSDNALNTILIKILNSETQQSSLEPLYESLNSVMNKTRAPIKYLLATSVLKLTEADKFNKAHKEEANILYILKVLQSNLRSLDSSSDENVITNEAGINVSMLEEEEEKKNSGDY